MLPGFLILKAPGPRLSRFLSITILHHVNRKSNRFIERVFPKPDRECTILNVELGLFVYLAGLG